MANPASTAPLPRYPRAVWPLASMAVADGFASSSLSQSVTAQFGTGPLDTLDLYLAAVALSGVWVMLGGWLADRHAGLQRVVLIGSVLLIAALAALAIPSTGTIAPSMAVMTMASALVRTNVPMLLAAEYGSSDPRRYPGFLLLYAAGALGGIAGSSVAPMVFATLGRSAALLVASGVVAVLTVIFVSGRRRLSLTTMTATQVLTPLRRSSTIIAWSVFVLVPLTVLVWMNLLQPVVLPFRLAIGAIVTIAPAAFLVWATLTRRSPRIERDRMRLILGLTVALVIFWLSTYVVDANSSANLDGLTRYGAIGLLIAPVSALALSLSWPWITRRGFRANIPVALAMALTMTGCGIVLGWASLHPNVLIRSLAVSTSTIFLALGEVVVYPLCMSVVTRLAPAPIAATTLAAWSASSSFLYYDVGGALVASSLAFLVAAILCVVAAAVFLTQRGRLSDVIEGVPLPVSRATGSRSIRVATYATMVLVLVAAGFAAIRAQAPDTPPIAASVALRFSPAAANLPDDDMLGFVEIPAGDILMGDEPRRSATPDEAPQGAVTLPPFFIGRYEVTVGQYRACVDAKGCRVNDARVLDDPDNWPVRRVSWQETMNYCNWLQTRLQTMPQLPAKLAALFSRVNDLLVTLPSEAEWERAARSFTGAPYPWGPALDPSQANYVESGRLSPVPVGRYPTVSAWGLHDTSGNVAEWTRSEFRKYPYVASDGREGLLASNRVVRGGSFYDNVTLLRTTSRQTADPDFGYDFVGFRVVIETRGAPGGDVAPAPRAPNVSAPRPPAAAK